MNDQYIDSELVPLINKHEYFLSETFAVAPSDYQELAQFRQHNQFELPKWIKDGLCQKPEKIECNLGIECDDCPFIVRVEKTALEQASDKIVHVNSEKGDKLQDAVDKLKADEDKIDRAVKPVQPKKEEPPPTP